MMGRAAEVDREALAVDTLQVPANCDRLYLYAGGYLVGVSATVKTLDGWNRPRSKNASLDGSVRVEIVNYDDTAVVGRFIIPIGWGFHKGGVMLPEPVINLNTACPYILKFLDKPPALIVHQIACWENTPQFMLYREEHIWKAEQ